MPTGIEWTSETWNPVVAYLDGKRGWHCEHASDGCKLCYAEVLNRRLGTGLDFKPGNRKLITISLDDKMLDKPLHWRRPRLIFPGSMTDLFASFVTDLMLDEIFSIVHRCPQHQFQFLTKRPDRLLEYARRAMGCGEHWLAHIEDSIHSPAAMWPLPNVWLGTSVEDGRQAHRIDILRQVPAHIRWISFEPQIGRVPNPDLRGIQWAVTGGESGGRSRPRHPDWAREIRDACADQGVAYFEKQQGDWVVVYDRDKEDPDWRRCDHVARETPRGQWLNLAGGQGFHGERVVRVVRVGKKVAGRMLDGVQHDGMPAYGEEAGGEVA
jgi:protein gp37